MAPYGRARSVLLALITVLALNGPLAFASGDNASNTQAVVPITTQSPEARKLYDSGLIKLENLRTEAALADFRQAVKLDPDFAMAYIMISLDTVNVTIDPAEQLSARAKAAAVKSRLSRGEQLIVDWQIASSEGHMIPAIQAMNEALQEYPGDEHLAWLAGVWTENQQQITRAIPMFERAIDLDPQFAAPLNEVAYCYARVRMFDKAFAAMRRYTTLLPSEPNPQDSYAEILRMAGKFDEALEHYHASLRLDPNFVESQLGVADTYALMGDESRARAEYAIAIRKSYSKVQALNWGLNAAITYIREKNYSGADSAFRLIAQQSHEANLAVPEAEAYRMMAAYQTRGDVAMSLLRKAEDVLKEKHPLPPMIRQEELAAILRERVSRAAGGGNSALADATLSRLKALADAGHDQLIQLAYDGAAGAVLVAQGKYEEALSHLEEDDRNPLSMKLMVRAYDKVGAKELSTQLSDTLAHWNEPTLEQALVAPEFQARQPASAASYSSFRRM